jgi:hypothetical protein
MSESLGHFCLCQACLDAKLGEQGHECEVLGRMYARSHADSEALDL